MKKRFISKLLMATLVVVTMGVFSSCKDYDDDINANSAEIQNLKSQVKTLEDAKAKLEADLASVNNTLTNSIQAAQTKAENDLKEAKAALEKAIADGDADAIKKAQQLVEDAEARILDSAAKTAELKAQAAADAAKIEILNKLNEDVKKLEDALALRYTKEEVDDLLKGYVTTGKLDEAVKSLSEDITKLQNELKANSDADAIIQGKMDEIYKRAIEGGDIDKAIAKVASDLSALDSKLNNLIDDDKAKENAGFATLVGLNQAWDQIRINDAAIKALQAYVDNFDKEVLPTLAKLTDVQKAIADLRTELKAEIDKKASKDELKEQIDAVYKKLEEEYATQDWTTEKIKNAFDELKAFVEGNYYTKKDVDDQVTILDGKIGDAKAEAFAYTDKLRSELDGIIMAKINANNATLKQEIYGKVEGMISDALSAALAKYTTTTDLMSLLADYVKDADLGGKIDAKLNEFYTKKLEEKMNEISTISQKLAYMDNQLTILAEELNQLNNFEIPADEEEATAEGRAKASATATSGIDALVDYLKALNEKFTNLHDYVEVTIKAVEANLDNIKLFVTKNLTSLVYRPEVLVGDEESETANMAYLYGFPVIRALLLEPQEVYGFTFAKVDATPAPGQDDDMAALHALYYGDKADFMDTPNPSDSKESKQFDIVAKYWLNPSSTDITKYDWQFDEVAGKNFISRGNEDTDKAGVTANVIGVDKDGVLSVALILDKGENVNNANTKSIAMESNSCYAWITTVALQAVRNDVDLKECTDTVTSDYAIIVPDYMNNLLLAYNKFAEKDHVEGNNMFHLRTDYQALLGENDRGVFSDSLEYNANEVVDLTKIDIHYDGDAFIMSHEEAEKRGFEFDYELLTNGGENGYFELNKENQTISIKEGKKDINSVGKVCNVRVMLKEKGKTDGKSYTYGYISIIITNVKKTVPVPVPNLVLQCTDGADNDFTTSITWAELEQKIIEVVGESFSFDNYTIDLGAYMTKVDENGQELTTDIKASTLKKETLDNKDALVWGFSEDLVKKLFYNDDNTAKYAYDETGKSDQKFTVYVNLEPKDGRPDVADVSLKIELQGLVYPTAKFTMDQRIERYWFKHWTDDIAIDKADRQEVHANVDVVGQMQTINVSAKADDDFYFDASSFFVKNEFKFVPTSPFNWASTINNEAPLYFDSEAYDVVPTIGSVISSPKEIVTGASGATYALYLTDIFSLKLMATKAVDGAYKTSADDQVVVELSDGEKVAPNKPGLKFHEYVKFMGKRDETYSYARDLLNYAAHYELGDEVTNDPQTFTTHMIFADNNELSCLPIALSGDRNFDIRYLRPLSASKKLPKIIEDAVDGGSDATKIYLTDIASFEDWRKIKFTAENHMDYLYYYGVKKIVADFDNARTNLNGGANLAYDAATNTAKEMTAADEAAAKNWPLITDVTSKLKFTPDEAAKTPASELSRTNDYNTFKFTNCGYYEYQNNAGNVGTFQIYLPISIVYDWGETKQEYVLVTITRTKGQDITGRARLN